MQSNPRKHVTCRRCKGSHYDPVEIGRRCLRCGGSACDPENIAADVDALCSAIDPPSRRYSRVIPFELREGKQRGRHETPSNDMPSPATLRARAYRMLAIIAAAAFFFGFVAGQLAGCAPSPAPLPALDDEPLVDSLLVPVPSARPAPSELQLQAEVAARSLEVTAAQDAIAEKGWRIASISQFARVGVWYRAEPFWSVGLGTVQAANMDSEPYLDSRVVVVNGKSYTVDRWISPRATISAQWIGGEGSTQGRAMSLIAVVRPSPLHVMKWHHGAERFEAAPVELER